MKEIDKDLIAKLQEHFLSDPEQKFDLIEKFSSQFVSDPNQTLREMLRIIHGLKGDAQIVGFIELSKMLHDFETSLQEVELRSLVNESIQDIMIMIRRLSTVIRVMFDCLKSKTEFTLRDKNIWNSTLTDLKVLLEDCEPKGSEVVSIDFEKIKLKDTTIDFSQGWGIFDDDVAPSKLAAADKDLNYSAQDIQNQVVLAKIPGPSSLPNKPKVIAKEIPTSVNVERYLLCSVKGHFFAVPVRYVQEIMPDKYLKRLPISRRNVAGVMSFRGQVTPVLDVFDHSEMEKDQSGADEVQNQRCIIVCQVGKGLFGFRINEASTVIEVSDDQLQQIHIKNEADSKRIVSHLAHINGQTISFIDLAGVVAT